MEEVEQARALCLDYLHDLCPHSAALWDYRRPLGYCGVFFWARLATTTFTTTSTTTRLIPTSTTIFTH